MQLQMELGENNLQLGDAVVTEQGKLVISDFKVYMSDIYVHYTSGDSVLWADVILLDKENLSSIKNEFYPIPSEGYVAISAGLGVKPALNEGVDPSEFSPEHPLSFQSSNGMHWGWQTGYKFLIFEAMADTGSGNINWPISYHVGTTEMYTRFKVDIPAGTSSIVLEDVVSNIFKDGVSNLTITKEPQTHTINNKEVARKFRDGFIKSLRVK